MKSSWKTEAGSWKTEAGSWKTEAGSWKTEAGSWKTEAGSWKILMGKCFREFVYDIRTSGTGFQASVFKLRSYQLCTKLKLKYNEKINIKLSFNSPGNRII